MGGEGYRVGAEGKISLAGQRRTRVSVTEKKAYAELFKQAGGEGGVL